MASSMLKRSVLQRGSPHHLSAVKPTPRRYSRSAICFAERADKDPHVQLATAKLPERVPADAFSSYMYQWATTLTQSGANYPFALPLKTDKLPLGFKITFLKQKQKGVFASAGDIEATVEAADKEPGNMFVVRFYEGPASLPDNIENAPTDPQERLEVVLDTLVDVPTIMQNMSPAISRAAKLAIASQEEQQQQQA